MALVDLRPNDRALLEHLIDHTAQVLELRRALALLWLDDGDDPQEVAERLRVSRQTVYHWVQRFQERTGAPFQQRLADDPRSGRPPTAQGIIDPLLSEVFEDDPRAWGYPTTVWTAALLQQFLRDVHGLEVSAQSVRLAIDRLELVWKRPRHRLARRPDTWRQSKGGSNAACGAGSAPCC